jgi:hypothetical protein
MAGRHKGYFSYFFSDLVAKIDGSTIKNTQVK